MKKKLAIPCKPRSYEDNYFVYLNDTTKLDISKYRKVSKYNTLYVTVYSGLHGSYIPKKYYKFSNRNTMHCLDYRHDWWTNGLTHHYEVPIISKCGNIVKTPIGSVVIT